MSTPEKKCKICESKTKTYLKGIYDNRHGYPDRFSLIRCTKCGFIQTKPQLSQKKLTNIYTDYYPRRNANIKKIIEYANSQPNKKEVYQKGLETTCHYNTKKGQKVLDIGCGTCQSLLEIEKMGGEAWGIDIDKNSERVAKSLNLKFYLGTIRDCSLPKEYFDLITASQVLEHDPDPIRFLATCKKYLKKDGRILLSFPNTDTPFRKIWGKHWLHWHIPYHLNHFNKKSIEILAEKAGVEIVSIKTVTPNLWTLLQIRSYINLNKEGERDPMWDSNQKGDQIKQKKSLPITLLTLTLPLIESLLFFNRIFDSLGMGESFVVKLKKI